VTVVPGEVFTVVEVAIERYEVRAIRRENEVNTAGMERRTTALSSAGAVKEKKRVKRA